MKLTYDEKINLIEVWQVYAYKLKEHLIDDEINRKNIRLVVFYFNKACSLTHKILCYPLWGSNSSEEHSEEQNNHLCETQCPIYEFCGGNDGDTKNHKRAVELNAYLRELIDQSLTEENIKTINNLAEEVIECSKILVEIETNLMGD